ncbi:MAG TPA: thioredoxin domain-containing protein [Polyangia bacterium]
MKPLLPVHAADHVRGPVDAPLTIVQYGDYDCPHTRASHGVLARLLPSLDHEVRFVFRHFPLRHIHVNAEVIAEIAEAAAVQGKFWPMHDHLMAHRKRVTREHVMADAVAAGVALDAIDDLVGSPAIRSRIESDVESGKASGVHSTPTFFFNGTLFDGHYDDKTLREQIDRALGSGSGA